MIRRQLALRAGSTFFACIDLSHNGHVHIQQKNSKGNGLQCMWVGSLSIADKFAQDVVSGAHFVLCQDKHCLLAVTFADPICDTLQYLVALQATICIPHTISLRVSAST